MIVHNVKIGEKTSGYVADRAHKRIYVGCAESDIRYRDMLVNGRHRWELYSKPTIDFITWEIDRSLSYNIPIVGVDVRPYSEGIVPT